MWLYPVPIGIGSGRSGRDCYRELLRIPLLRTPVNRAKGRAEAATSPGPSCSRYVTLHLRSDMTVRRDDGWLLRPFVVTLDVYAFNCKPEEKWKFPKKRTYASNQAKCPCVLGVKNVSIGIYQIA